MKKLGMLRWLWSLAAVLMLLGGLAACSDGGDGGINPPVSGPVVTPTPTPTTTVNVKGVVLVDSTGKASSSTYVGASSITLKATILPSNATNQVVSWTSSDTNVADVTGNGLTASVTVKAAGKATITVTTADGNKTAIYSITAYASQDSQAAITALAGVYSAGGKTVSIGADGKVTVDGESGTATVTKNADGTYAVKSTVGGTEYAITLNADGTVANVTAGGTAVSLEKAKIAVTKKDGSSTVCTTIQAALDSCTGNDPYVITLQPGTYEEDGLTYNGAATVKISGATKAKYGADVIIKGKGSNQAAEKTRCTIEFQGTGNFIMENLTVQNTFTRVGYSGGTTQCEAIGFDSTGYIVGYNCAFKSHQDTMRTTGKGWFYNCYVEGDVDFIWMEVSGIVALYENCEIVMKSDESASGYIFAPRANVASQIGKGNVILNSTITIPSTSSVPDEKTGEYKYDAYLFRNPWGVNPSYYNQGAVVGTTINGKFNDKLAKSDAMGTIDQQYIGWKVDSEIASAYTAKASTIGTLSDNIKTREYGGRRTILNRMYSVATAKFKKDNETWWDIDSLIAVNGWNVTTDSSSDSVSGEVESTVKIYMFDSDEVPAGITCDGFKKEAGKPHYGAVNDTGTITFDVLGKCVVSVFGYYAGYGTIQIPGQGEAVYDFNNKTTNAQVEKSYVNYTGAGKVTIKSSTTSYVTKIKVEYDESLAYVPVRGITVSSEKDKATVGVSFTVSASATPEGATLKDVKWSSSNTEIATVNELTGEVIPVKEGDVEIIATARDGSAVTGKKAYKVVAASWTIAEWYKTTEGDNTVEAGQNHDAYTANTDKSLAAETSFKNLAGETITTKHGQKLNSSGKMNVSTIASAILTVITFEGNNTVAAPKVTGNLETSKATMLEEHPHDTTNNTTTYTFYLSGADTWTIARSVETSENNPIVYVKCELAPVPGNKYTYDFSNVYHSAKGFSSDMLVAWDAVCGNDHGIQNGTITVKVFKNTKVTLGLCQYDNPTALALKEGDNVLVSWTAPIATECFSKSHPDPVANDKNSYTYIYKGTSETATLTITGFSYFEGIVLEPFAGDVKVTSVSVSAGDTTSLVAGGKKQLSATVLPADATVSTVTWTSSDTSIATVNSSGLVVGVNAGNVRITAKSTDGTEKSGYVDLTVTAAPAGSWMVETAENGTFTMGDLTVVVSGANPNGHGSEVKADGSTSVKISIPAGSYILDAGTCKYGTADKTYKLTCANTDFTQEYIGTHTYATEDCYNPGSGRTDLYGDIFMVKSASAMEITLNSDSVKEYLPFIKVVKTPTYFVETADNGTFTMGDLTVVVSGANPNGHGSEVKADGSTSVKISIPAGSYILDAGTCKYGTADKTYKLTCANTDFTQEYIGTHTYATEDCYNPGSGRTDLYGDIFMVKSASAMEITLNSDSVKEYLPFIGVIK